MMKKIFYIENKLTKERMLSARGHFFNSPNGAFLSFVSYYRDRKKCEHYFKGVPKGGVYSKEKIENIKTIFDKYFEIKEVEV